MSRKILFIVDKVEYGGAEKITLDIAKELSYDNDYEIFLISLIKPDIAIKFEKLNFIQPRKNFLKFYHFWRYYEIFKLIHKINPEIIQSSMENSDWIVGLFKIIHRKTITISVIHTYLKRRQHKILLKHKMFFKLQGLIFKSFNKIVCVSNDLKKYMNYEYNLNENKLQTIYNGINIRQNFPHYKMNKQFRGNLIYIGGLRPVKNLKLLLDVLDKLPARYNLTLVGKGTQKKDLQKYIELKRLRKRVRFLGFYPDAYKELVNYDILIIPSLYETFSLVILEGLYVGIPTIFTKNCGIKELLPKELKTLLFEPNNIDELYAKILMVQEKHSEIIKLISKYKTLFKNYSNSNMIKKYIDLYQSYL